MSASWKAAWQMSFAFFQRFADAILFGYVPAQFLYVTFRLLQAFSLAQFRALTFGFFAAPAIEANIEILVVSEIDDGNKWKRLPLTVKSTVLKERNIMAAAAAPPK